MKVEISLANAAVLTEYVEDTLSKADVPMGAIMKMNIALDEIFSNIVKFSKAGYAEITCYVKDAAAYLVFEDDGVRYNPLEAADPDTSLSAQDRKIGGLGIFMVKKSMTSMDYEYKDGKNILTLRLKY